MRERVHELSGMLRGLPNTALQRIAALLRFRLKPNSYSGAARAEGRR